MTSVLTTKQQRTLDRAANDAIGRAGRCAPAITCPAPPLMRAAQRRRRWAHGACPAPSCTLPADASGHCVLHRERVKLKLSDERGNVRAFVRRGVVTFGVFTPGETPAPPDNWHATLPPHAPCNG